MKKEDTGPTPRWARRKEARPAELLDAALAMFVERGFAATRLDDIAARAGVTKGTLYLYYAGKEELLEAVVRAGIVPVVREAEQAVATFAGTSAELIGHLVEVWWKAIGATHLSGIPKLVIAEAGNFPEVARLYHDEVIAPVSSLIETLLRRGMQSGEFRPVDAEYLRHIVMAPLFMLNVWTHSFARHAGSSLDSRRYLDAYLNLLLAGLDPAGVNPGESSCRQHPNPTC